MVKCVFCAFENEDGALFCEQCKSDLSSVPSTPAATPQPAELPAAAIVLDAPFAVEAAPIPLVEAVAIEAVAVAEALPIEALPMEAMPVAVFAEAQAIEAFPVASIEPATATPIESFPVLNLEAALPVVEAIPVMPVAEVLPVVEPTPAPIPVAVAAPTPVAPPPPAPAPIPVAAAAAVVAPAPAAPASPSAALAPGAQPRLKVMRGLKVGVEFPLYADYNYIGRADEKPVDVDLEDQEPPDRVWCSRQHAVIHFDEAAGVLTLEDLNSSNGTYVNRTRVYPGEKRPLSPNDVVQIGTVHMKLLV